MECFWSWQMQHVCKWMKNYSLGAKESSGVRYLVLFLFCFYFLFNFFRRFASLSNFISNLMLYLTCKAFIKRYTEFWTSPFIVFIQINSHVPDWCTLIVLQCRFHSIDHCLFWESFLQLYSCILEVYMYKHTIKL